MVREINKDTGILSTPSKEASETDLPIAADLKDTLLFHRQECVGMAANMIGELKRIIAFFDGEQCVTMLNPEIVKKSGKFKTEEGCLSLSGTRSTERYAAIRVRFTDELLRTRQKCYTGFTAQIIQHEIDHLNGILI